MIEDASSGNADDEFAYVLAFLHGSDGGLDVNCIEHPDRPDGLESPSAVVLHELLAQLSDAMRLLCYYGPHFDAEEGAVTLEGFHIEPSLADEVAFPNLYHTAELGNALPLYRGGSVRT